MLSKAKKMTRTAGLPSFIDFCNQQVEPDQRNFIDWLKRHEYDVPPLMRTYLILSWRMINHNPTNDNMVDAAVELVTGI